MRSSGVRVWNLGEEVTVVVGCRRAFLVVWGLRTTMDMGMTSAFRGSSIWGLGMRMDHGPNEKATKLCLWSQEKASRLGLATGKQMVCFGISRSSYFITCALRVHDGKTPKPCWRKIKFETRSY